MSLGAPNNIVPHVTSPPVPASLIPPLDMSRARNEKDVKARIKALLNCWGWYTWMPPANGYGTVGVHDHNAIKNGVFLTIEAKFGTNKPTTMQKSFAGHIISNSGFSFCVNEKNIDHLAWWLESFEIATQHQIRGEPVPAEHGARLMNSMSVLTELWR